VSVGGVIVGFYTFAFVGMVGLIAYERLISA
jgi:hypothetical protein